MDSVLTAERGLRLLSDAQRDIAETLAQHVPHLNYGVPVQLTTSDNKVFSLPSSAEWIGRIEVYRTLAGELLVEGPFWDPSADYTVEGPSSIRITDNRTWTGAAPYVRYQARPGELDGSGAADPVLLPTAVRAAVVARAAAMFAQRGGLRDPAPYEAEVERVLWGSGTSYGQGGIIPGAKARMEGYDTPTVWWRSITTS